MSSISLPKSPPLAFVSSVPNTRLFSDETEDTANGPEKAPMNATLIGPFDDWSVVLDDEEAQAVRPTTATSSSADARAPTFLVTPSNTLELEPIIRFSSTQAPEAIGNMQAQSGFNMAFASRTSPGGKPPWLILLQLYFSFGEVKPTPPMPAVLSIAALILVGSSPPACLIAHTTDNHSSYPVPPPTPGFLPNLL